MNSFHYVLNVTFHKHRNVNHKLARMILTSSRINTQHDIFCFHRTKTLRIQKNLVTFRRQVGFVTRRFQRPPKKTATRATSKNDPSLVRWNILHLFTGNFVKPVRNKRTNAASKYTIPSKDRADLFGQGLSFVEVH